MLLDRDPPKEDLDKIKIAPTKLDEEQIPLYVRDWCLENCTEYGSCDWLKDNCSYYNTPQWRHDKEKKKE